jgi:diguanylate cyclase (GGDEF)-like protein
MSAQLSRVWTGKPGETHRRRRKDHPQEHVRPFSRRPAVSKTLSVSSGNGEHLELPGNAQQGVTFGAPRLSRKRRLPRIAVLLTLVLLIPVTSLAAVTGSSAISNWNAREAAATVREDVAAPSALMTARALVVDEGLPSTALANAADNHVSPLILTRVTGIDFAAAVRKARPFVTENATLRAYPSLAADLTALAALRTKLDKGAATYAEVLKFYTGFSADIDSLWRNQFDHLRQDVTASSRATGVLAERISVLPTTYSLLTSLVQRAADANALILNPRSSGSLRTLLIGTGAYNADAAVLAGRLGPEATAAWQVMQRDAAVARFDKAMTQTANLALAGRPSPFVDDPASRASAFADGQRWLDDLQAVVQGASADVHAIAQSEELSATRSFQIAIAVFLLSVLFALAAALLLTRSVVLPLRRLARAARRVAAGDFTLPAVPASGPREVADTIGAVDDMTAVLAAVESFTVTLAKDPTAASLDVPLPGSTGLALQTTLDRLRESVREAERQRVVLHKVATHDGLTGLLNRAAALDTVTLALEQARLSGGAVMVLFIDLDGLKAINDTHGHKVGDEAIRLAALALSQATRTTDLVARLGGDEFLVAGTFSPDEDDLHSLAERIHGAVADSPLQVDQLTIPLRCSIGIAMSLPADDVESLIHKADQALYAAKRKGRNQISWHQRTAAAVVPTPRGDYQAVGLPDR